MKVIIQIGIIFLVCYFVWFRDNNEPKTNKTLDNNLSVKSVHLGFSDTLITQKTFKDNGIIKENYSYFPVSNGQEFEYIYNKKDRVRFLQSDSTDIIYIIDEHGNKLGTSLDSTVNLSSEIKDDLRKVKVKIISAKEFGAYTFKKQ